MCRVELKSWSCATELTSCLLPAACFLQLRLVNCLNVERFRHAVAYDWASGTCGPLPCLFSLFLSSFNVFLPVWRTLCYPAVWLLVDLHVNELLVRTPPHTCQATCLLVVSKATWESHASCRPTTLSHLLINEITCSKRRSQTNLSGERITISPLVAASLCGIFSFWSRLSLSSGRCIRCSPCPIASSFVVLSFFHALSST